MARPKKRHQPDGRRQSRRAATKESLICERGMPMLDHAVIEAADQSALATLERFEDLEAHGKATEQDFRNLVGLLCRIGCSGEAEHVLRINLLRVREDGETLYEDKDRLSLYLELFGTTKQAELAAGIADFSKQFSARLTHARRDVSFWHAFDCKARRACLDRYGLRNEPCYVNFEYDARDCVDAQMWSLKSEDRLIYLRWAEGVWEILGAGIGCVGSEG